jgi:hypothetical protein
MTRFLTLAGVCGLVGLLSAAPNAQVEASDRLPAPLDGITTDLSQIENLFRVTEVRLYARDEFRVGEPGRVVAEETIVWTLEAKVSLTGAQIHRLFHNPRPTVLFIKLAEGREVNADARPDGYKLIADLRWFRLRPQGTELAKGETMKVWVHLGKEGSNGIVDSKAAKMALKMD